jgi:mannose-6-phosphate isomerase-like protein (cupin superfamily)
MKLTILSILLLFFSITGLANEKHGTREVLLDNESVEVVRLIYPAGTESGMHTHVHPNRVVYFIKGGKLELIPEDKEKQPSLLNVPDGKTLFLPSTIHNVRNVGNTEVVILETEIKKR